MSVVDQIRDQARSRMRWMAVHGFIRFFAKRGLAIGDPYAKLVADPAIRADPTPVYDQIRKAGPLVKTSVVYLTVDHSLTIELLRSDDFRSVIQGASLPVPLRAIERRTRASTLHPLSPPSLLCSEPPTHTRYRKVVSSVFTVRAVNQMRDRLRVTAGALLDELVASGVEEVDIVDAYCAKLSVAVISDILGVPVQDRDQVLEFGELVSLSLDFGLTWPQFRSVENGLHRFDDWLGEHIDYLRAHPGDNLFSHLIASSHDGVHLDDRELRATAGLVLAAGFETTANLLGSGINLLMNHAEQLARLVEDPSLWPNAIDEMLRLEAPVQMTARIAKHPVETAGLAIPAEATVFVVLAGANRDPNVFDYPDKFDVGRSNANKHLSFSGGRHFCLGAALTRAEAEVGLRTLFERFPKLSAAGAGIKRDTRVLRGFLSLPVDLGESVTIDA